MPLKSAPLRRLALNRRTLTLAALAAAVTACGGGTSDDAAATTLPVITAQPIAVLVQAGQSAVFRVVAQSSTPLSYQWLRNGAPIPGATSAEFTLAAVTTVDAGSRFSVVVSNVAGAVQSEAVSLAVQIVGSIALATGALAALGTDMTAVGFSQSGDTYVWNRSAKKLVRMTPDGTAVPLRGSLPAVDVDPWRLCVIEHSNGSLYVSETYLKNSQQINTEWGNGGRIHRISPGGDHSIVYDHRTAAIPLTPMAIAEGKDAQLYLLHLNGIALYRLSPGTGAITKIASLISETVAENLIVLGRDNLHLVSTSSGSIFVASRGGSFTDSSTGGSKYFEPFSYQIHPDGTLVPVDIGLRDVYDMRAHKDQVYVLGRDASDRMRLFLRTPTGGVLRVAGGAAPGMIGAGPLPGSLEASTYVGLAGITPNGQPVVGEVAGPMLALKKYSRYFVINHSA